MSLADIQAMKALKQILGIKNNLTNFDTAYIKGNKLVCNDSKINSSTTAKYVTVDIGPGNVPTTMKCKNIFTVGSSSGTIALISNPNGRSAINNITTKSLHIIFKANSVSTQIWNAGSLTNIDTYFFTQFPLDNQTEVQYQWSISGDTITHNINGITRQVTYAGLSSYMGRYCTLEHFYNAPFSTVAKPQFTYFEVNGTGFDPVIDDFKRNDGSIGVSKSGHTYSLLSEIAG